MIAKLITLLNDKVVIQITITVLEYLVQKSSNKLDDEVVRMVRQRLLPKEPATKVQLKKA